MKSFLIKFLFILLCLYLIAEYGLESMDSTRDEFTVTECSDEIEIVKDEYIHHRGWKGLEGNDHCDQYVTDATNFQSSIQLRKSIRIPPQSDHKIFWNRLYGAFLKIHATQIAETFSPIFYRMDSLNWSIRQQAKYLVSMVQDLPYAYILQSESCREKKADGGCITGIRYGILSPYEFLHSEKGDCDTRAVLLYSLFEQLGLQPKIAVSEVYAHAMLMVDLPSAGAFLEENGVRYFFWETTYPNWDIGMMPPDCNNLNNWTIVI